MKKKIGKQVKKNKAEKINFEEVVKFFNLLRRKFSLGAEISIGGSECLDDSCVGVKGFDSIGVVNKKDVITDTPTLVRSFEMFLDDEVEPIGGLIEEIDSSNKELFGGKLDQNWDKDDVRVPF